MQSRALGRWVEVWVDEGDEGEDRSVLVVGRPVNHALCQLPHGATLVLRILPVI
jgi:hypothetical protein